MSEMINPHDRVYHSFYGWGYVSGINEHNGAIMVFPGRKEIPGSTIVPLSELSKTSPEPVAVEPQAAPVDNDADTLAAVLAERDALRERVKELEAALIQTQDALRPFMNCTAWIEATRTKNSDGRTLRSYSNTVLTNRTGPLDMLMGVHFHQAEHAYINAADTLKGRQS